jgi:hypothetical protein
MLTKSSKPAVRRCNLVCSWLVCNISSGQRTFSRRSTSGTGYVSHTRREKSPFIVHGRYWRLMHWSISSSSATSHRRSLGWTIHSTARPAARTSSVSSPRWTFQKGNSNCSPWGYTTHSTNQSRPRNVREECLESLHCTTVHLKVSIIRKMSIS